MPAITSYITSALLLAAQSLAAPNPAPAYNIASLEGSVQASVQDVATVGYATLGAGTKGGKGGTTVTVSTLSALSAACLDDEPKIIMVTGTISGAGKTRCGSNKSIIGKSSAAHLSGNGLFIRNAKNIIIRNLKISKVKAGDGDAIGIQSSTNIWIDHVDVSSDRNSGKDFYDGLLDLSHATDFVTISNSHIHDHYKASLVGHSDKNEAEDTGKLHVTYVNNYWVNVNSRAPSLRFGTGHIFDSLFVNVNDGINVRRGAQVLVQDNVFENGTQPLYTVDATGGAVEKGNDFGNPKMAVKMQTVGKLTGVPYKFETAGLESVKGRLPKVAGNTLSF
ncbi:pectate lyase 1 [Tothia fuscella]|uniref:Pectate lyase 1 n=1 Tax=Tothia fuscella TaxID=1048955 RepID=A0A9P4U2Y8_9PEZI|nr:pectate lyase 1 [Tothia fuscella]